MNTFEEFNGDPVAMADEIDRLRGKRPDFRPKRQCMNSPNRKDHIWCRLIEGHDGPHQSSKGREW